jgi:hypothetical protein
LPTVDVRHFRYDCIEETVVPGSSLVWTTFGYTSSGNRFEFRLATAFQPLWKDEWAMPLPSSSSGDDDEQHDWRAYDMGWGFWTVVDTRAAQNNVILV